MVYFLISSIIFYILCFTVEVYDNEKLILYIGQLTESETVN